MSYFKKNERQNNCLILASDHAGFIDVAFVAALFEKIKSLDEMVLSGCSWVVMSVPGATDVDMRAMQILCRIAVYLGKKNCQLACITNENSCQSIKRNNINSLVYPYSSLELFYSEQKIDDVEHIKLFIETMTYSVFETMKVLTGLEVRVEKLESAKGGASQSLPGVQIGATAGLVCAHFSGSITIGFSNEVFKEIMSRFVQQKVEEITDEIRDGASEILNVVVGQIKMVLNEKKYNINQVIPSILSGERIVMTPVAGQISTLIHYRSEIGDFYILFSANSQQKIALAG